MKKDTATGDFFKFLKCLKMGKLLCVVVIGGVVGVVVGGCEPASCKRLREVMCGACGAQSAACVKLEEKTDTEAACTQTLGELNDLLERLEKVSVAEREARMQRMCAGP